MDGRLAGSRAVVVHVGSELGRACALRFADEGAEVLVADPLADVADAVKAEIVERGRVGHAVEAAFGDESAIARVAERCSELWDRLDTLMVCAGAIDWWPDEEDTMENWEGVLRVNLLTPVFYTKALRGLLAKSGHGSVIYYGSVDGVHGNPQAPVYSASRGALVPYTHVMAHALGPDGTRVNYIAGAAIGPFGPEAPPLRGPFNDGRQLMLATPVGRPATPDDVAGVAAFLASTDSAYVTGAVIMHEGGRTAITPGTSLRL